MAEELLEGVRRFRDSDLAHNRERYERLAREGQRPETLFVTCSDSRIVPHLLTDTGPGDLFVVRTIGNIVAPPDAAGTDPTLAAVEFAVVALGVSHIIVCGHSACGAMRALYEGVPGALSSLDPWVEQAREAKLPPAELERCADDAERDRRTAQRNVALALERLAAHPVVAERRADEALRLHGWHYDIASGEVSVLDQASGAFETPAAPS